MTLFRLEDFSTRSEAEEYVENWLFWHPLGQGRVVSIGGGFAVEVMR